MKGQTEEKIVDETKKDDYPGEQIRNEPQRIKASRKRYEMIDANNIKNINNCCNGMHQKFKIAKAPRLPCSTSFNFKFCRISPKIIQVPVLYSSAKLR